MWVRDDLDGSPLGERSEQLAPEFRFSASIRPAQVRGVHRITDLLFYFLFLFFWVFFLFILFCVRRARNFLHLLLL